MNSEFTAAVFARTFKDLYIRGTRPSVLYPAVESRQVRVYVFVVRHFGSILLARVQDQNQRKMKYTAEAKQVEDILNFTCAFVFPWRVLFFDGPNINSGTFFLSINRFERKKNLELALKAFAHFRLSPRKCAADRVMLVLAGGFDKRLKENVEYFKQLKR